MVAVAGYSIETPRLLLLSATRRFPDGLGNDYDQVGRYLMVQGAPQTAGRFDDEVRMYKAPPPEVSSEQFYETDPTKPYRRGLSIQTVSPLPITWAEHVTAQGHWGAGAARVHARLRALGHPRRAVRVPARTGQPRHPGRRDRPPRPAGRPLRLHPVRQRQAADAGRARRRWRTSCAPPAPTRSSPSSATPTWSAAPGWPAGPEDGVVDADHRIFAVPNLYIADGSVLPTQGSANPALTIMALAARAADRLAPGAPGRRPREQACR